MNPLEMFQDLVEQVPAFLQPLIVALAGAVPFIEGEGAVTIGILGGMHPLLAATAATLGSFTCVFIAVQLSSRARTAILSQRSRRRELALSGGGTGQALPNTADLAADPQPKFSARQTARRAKFHRSFARYGVPGVSLLGPLLLPPIFTATMLAALGIPKQRILLWQAAGIVLWVAVSAVVFGLVVSTVH